MDVESDTEGFFYFTGIGAKPWPGREKELNEYLESLAKIGLSLDGIPWVVIDGLVNVPNFDKFDTIINCFGSMLAASFLFIPAPADPDIQPFGPCTVPFRVGPTTDGEVISGVTDPEFAALFATNKTMRAIVELHVWIRCGNVTRSQFMRAVVAPPHIARLGIVAITDVPALCPGNSQSGTSCRYIKMVDGAVEQAGSSS